MICNQHPILLPGKMAVNYEPYNKIRSEILNERVKKVFKKEIITPGIRLNSNKYDQKRVMTPKKAFKNGSDWLVIGRPITKGNIKKNLQNLLNHLS